MIGVFVQTNLESHASRTRPTGYVVQENGCWEWVGRVEPDGYGRSYVRGVGRTTAHRAEFLKSGRTIPDGCELDHLCCNTLCVRPDHLEPVTHKENTRRGNGTGGRNFRKTTCPHGRDYRIDFRGRRVCPRPCTRERYVREREKVGKIVGAPRPRRFNES